MHACVRFCIYIYTYISNINYDKISFPHLKKKLVANSLPWINGGKKKKRKTLTVMLLGTVIMYITVVVIV